MQTLSHSLRAGFLQILTCEGVAKQPNQTSLHESDDGRSANEGQGSEPLYLAGAAYLTSASNEDVQLPLLTTESTAALQPLPTKTPSTAARRCESIIRASSADPPRYPPPPAVFAPLLEPMFVCCSRTSSAKVTSQDHPPSTTRARPAREKDSRTWYQACSSTRPSRTAGCRRSRR